MECVDLDMFGVCIFLSAFSWAMAYVIVNR